MLTESCFPSLGGQVSSAQSSARTVKTAAPPRSAAKGCSVLGRPVTWPGVRWDQVCQPCRCPSFAFIDPTLHSHAPGPLVAESQAPLIRIEGSPL